MSLQLFNSSSIPTFGTRPIYIYVIYDDGIHIMYSGSCKKTWACRRLVWKQVTGEGRGKSNCWLEGKQVVRRRSIPAKTFHRCCTTYQVLGGGSEQNPPFLILIVDDKKHRCEILNSVQLVLLWAKQSKWFFHEQTPYYAPKIILPLETYMNKPFQNCGNIF